MNQDFSLFEQRLIEAGYDSDAIEQILEVAKNSIYPKKYGLVWEEKKEKIKEDLKLKIPYLEELNEREIKLSDANSPQHLLIEGDNYEALKLLQTTHRGKVGVIYIDPPYNTGKEFVYNDKLVDKEDGYRHSKWLSFMHKRLILAKELLSEDGVIFISIDDNEFAQLKLLCDEIFGENNFASNIIWQSTAGSNTGDNIITITEHILVYQKSQKANFKRLKFVNDGKMKLKDEFFEKRGKYALDKLDSRRQNSHYSDALNYQIKCPDGTLLFPGGSEEKQEGWNWLWSKTKVEWGILNGFIVFKQSKSGKWTIYNKRYEFVDNKDQPIERGTVFKNLILSSFATTSTGSKELKEIFNETKFDYPKPTKLIKQLIEIVANDSLILDFFAGSGTTGHAVLELNKEDGGNRQFILCTNNENNICEDVTYERLKRVMNGYTAPKGKEVEGLPANLKYLKVGMVEKETYTDEDLSYLYIPHVLPLLQLKHNAFHLVSETKHGWVFEGEGFRFGLADSLATKQDFDQLKEHLESYEGEKILYLFSTDTKSYPKYKQLASLDEIIRPIPREMLELLKGE